MISEPEILEEVKTDTAQFKRIAIPIIKRFYAQVFYISYSYNSDYYYLPLNVEEPKHKTRRKIDWSKEGF